jgi:tRNA U55 pseudouridine synthase TruB
MSVITSNLSTDPATRESQQESRDFCRQLINAQIKEKAILAETRVELAKQTMIRTVAGDVDKIIKCIAPNGSLDPVRRDQLLKDANANGALTNYAYLVTGPKDVSEFKTMLGQNGSVRAQLVSAVAESAACK